MKKNHGAQPVVTDNDHSHHVSCCARPEPAAVMSDLKRWEKMKTLRLFLTCLALVTACAAASPEKENTKAIVLSTQAIPKGKRIVGLRLEIYTARVRSFPEIPLDWHLSLELDGSYRAIVGGNYQHGVGGLNSAKSLDRFITVSASDWSEVRVEGVLFVTSDFETSQEIKIDSSKVGFTEIK